jgi:AcrR family transcriptional regulator
MDPKDNLLAASRRVFSRHGFRRSSMAMVAEEAGVSRQAIYHHFPSKELLFSALVDSLQSRAQDEAHAAVDGDEGQALPTQLFRALSAYHLSLVGSVAGSAFAEELMEESVRHCSDVVSAHAERFQKFLVSMVRAASDRGEIELIDNVTERQFVTMLLVAAKGVKLSYAQAGERAYMQALEQMISTLCRGTIVPVVRDSIKRRVAAGRARK